MTDSHSTFPFSISGDPPLTEPVCSGRREEGGTVNFIWGWGPPIGTGRPFLLTGAKVTCRLQPGGLTLRGAPMPCGESGGRELSPLGETGVFSLQRLPHRSRDLGSHLPAGSHERRLLGTPCVARGRALKGGCACVLPQAGCYVLCEGRAAGLRRLSPHALAQDRCKYVSPSKALFGAQSGQ